MYWNFSQVDDFLQTLISYDNESILENCLEVIKEHFSKGPDFNPNIFIQSPLQQQNLCAWIINVVKFNEVYILSVPFFTHIDGRISLSEGLYYLSNLGLVFWGESNSNHGQRGRYSVLNSMYACIYFLQKDVKDVWLSRSFQLSL